MTSYDPSMGCEPFLSLAAFVGKPLCAKRTKLGDWSIWLVFCTGKCHDGERILVVLVDMFVCTSIAQALGEWKSIIERVLITSVQTGDVLFQNHSVGEQLRK